MKSATPFDYSPAIIYRSWPKRANVNLNTTIYIHWITKHLYKLSLFILSKYKYFCFIRTFSIYKTFFFGMQHILNGFSACLFYIFYIFFGIHENVYENCIFSSNRIICSDAQEFIKWHQVSQSKTSVSIENPKEHVKFVICLILPGESIVNFERQISKFKRHKWASLWPKHTCTMIRCHCSACLCRCLSAVDYFKMHKSR